MQTLNINSPQTSSSLGTFELFSLQVGALFKKNLLICWRNKSAFLKELMLPIITALLIYSLNHINAVEYSLQIIFPISLLGYVRSFMVDIVHEKSEKYREYLKINGVTNSAYLVSMLLYGYLKCLVYSMITCSGFLFLKPGIFNFSVLTIFSLYLLIALASTHFGLLITVFFSSKQLCSDIGGTVFTLTSFVFPLAFQTSSKVWYYVSLLFPQNALGYILFPKAELGWSMDTLFLFVILDLFLYLVLFIYLDQILPNAFRTGKNWCFCIKSCFKKRSQADQGVVNEHHSLIEDFDANEEDQRRQFSPSNITTDTDEDGSSALYHEKFDNQSDLERTIYLEKITKKFKDEKALDKLSLMMYEKQVFCLLGHNGAGKTTLVNILTGMIPHDSGEIFYKGGKFDKNSSILRRSFGLCAQQDILYPDLTVYEHLDLIGRIRGKTGAELEREIERTLQKTTLGSERGKKVGVLSGGNKRKLSLGLAVLGNISMIFLDEPTSGMDPNTRRAVWDIIRELRNEGKTILLTTHHLDEADELSDRLGVMSKGKLFAVGTSEFIKKKFGVGYHLQITPNYEKNCSIEHFESLKEDIKDTVLRSVEVAKLDEQGGNTVLRFSLPFTHQERFPHLFEELENYEELKLNLKMNSLEDAFINIGLQEDLFFEDNASRESGGVSINLEPPRIIRSHIPQYNFFLQFEAMFLRKYFYTIRNYKNIVLIVSPVIFVIFGTMITVLKLRPLEKSDPETTQIVEAIIIVFFLFFVNLSYSLNATIYCVFPVYEREAKITYSLKVMGCRDLPYWLGTFLFDFLIVQIVNAILILMTFIFKIHYLEDHLFLLSLNLIFYSSSLICISYLCGFVFKNSSTVFKSYAAFYLFVLNVLPSIILNFALLLNLPEPLPTLLKFLLFLCSPNFAFNDAIYFSIGAKPIFLNSHFACLLWFLFLTVFYFSCVLYIHKKKLNVSLKATQTLQDSDFGYEGGVDISEMTTEVNRLETAQAQDPLKVLHLSKTYPNGFRAVKDISFGVQKGEIFGLLGPNGAGKSTTFHVSTAMIPRSGGEIRLKGKSIDEKLDDVFQDVGVCPQFDAIWEDLKVLEHFYIYALVKGIPLYDLKDVTTYLLDAVKLKEHQKKQAKKLSGGSKRKLNTAIALIGTPALKFFDEPSTGIDPMSKRFLWNCLQKYVTMRNGSILLTTHSMEEAEALCQRIGIIVNGKFVCLGPLQFLKDKYGAGYKITIVKKPERENVDDEIYEIFPNAKKIEEKREQQETYQVMSQSFKFSVALRALGELKRGRIIQDFSIYNTTLEQLFIDFSKNQTEPTLPDQLDSQM